MNAQRRTRSDPRAEATRAALIDEAEILFARAGVDGVSLREIGSAIGSANTNVVAYHFGTKDALVMAIFRQRLASIDLRRADLLSQADRTGTGGDLIALLDVLCRPFLEQVDRNGRHSYAAFIDGVFRSGRLPLRAALAPEFEATNAIAARIAGMCGADPFDKAFNTRLQLALSMVMATLQLIDHEGNGDGERAERLFTQTLEMMAAALRADTSK